MTEEINNMKIDNIDFRSILISRGGLRSIIKKAWGHEIIIHNDELYCGKILHFNKDAKCSMHFHVERHKTWYVSKGKLMLRSVDVDTAEEIEVEIKKGDVIEVFSGIPHQLHAIEAADIFEISTQFDDGDTFRIKKGDNQIKKS